ncbi:DsrH/TusB family sulfur relay protein [Sphingobium nicotianae]|uniref:Uncharacterized protein n=1 Tax=Sphingobium nicotianae TaxID=2782607 RepID=A0A9X1IT97_9SPHN|nr:DsrH/TusB family sulfur relay protein [Sphingobium nicotianae]MBT2188999.1 hypothetical protein [Sphingobium nicotianae]
MRAPASRNRSPAILRPVVPRLICASILTMTASCTSHVHLNAGAAGAPLAAGQAVTIIGIGPDGPAIAARAQDAVIAALGKHGYVLAPDAAARLEIGITDRPASTGIAVIGGAELSAAKGKRFLQSCKERTYRLVLTYYGPASDLPVTRAWAEEHHCRAAIDASIENLADKAVTALTKGSSSETGGRRARD